MIPCFVCLDHLKAPKPSSHWNFGFSKGEYERIKCIGFKSLQFYFFGSDGKILAFLFLSLHSITQILVMWGRQRNLYSTYKRISSKERLNGNASEDSLGTFFSFKL